VVGQPHSPADLAQEKLKRSPYCRKLFAPQSRSARVQFLPPDSQARNESLYRLYSWLKHCVTHRKFACSIPDGFIWIFLLTKSFRPPYGFGDTQPVTEMRTGFSFGGGRLKGSVRRADNLTNFLCRFPRNSGIPKPPLPHGSYPGHYFHQVFTNRGTSFEYYRLILWILILELASWNRFSHRFLRCLTFFLIVTTLSDTARNSNVLNCFRNCKCK